MSTSHYISSTNILKKLKQTRTGVMAISSSTFVGKIDPKEVIEKRTQDQVLVAIKTAESKIKTKERGIYFCVSSKHS